MRETALDGGVFPKGTAAGVDPGGTGGATNHTHTAAASHSHGMGGHTHTVPDVTDGTGSTARDTGSTNPPLTHSHVSNAASGTSATNTSGESVDTDTADHRPSYFETIFIKPDTNPAAGIPASAVAIWDTSTIPSGFNLCDGASGRPDLRLRFVRGAATSGDAGATGGATTHTHNIASHTHGGTISHTHSGSTSAANSTASTTGSISGANVGTATASHTHALTFAAGSASITGATDSTNAASNLPPYRKEAFIQNTSGGTISDELMPRGLIAMWLQSLASIPEGWVLCDGTQGTPDLRDTYVYGANTTGEVGNTGGGASHSAVAVGHVHALGSHNHAITMASGAGENRTAGATNAPTTAHTHAGWTNTGSTAPNSGSTAPTYNDTAAEPSYKTVAFIMKKEESVFELALPEQRQLYVKKVPQQPPSESKPVLVPVVTGFFAGDLEDLIYVFDRQLQYPAQQAPVRPLCPVLIADQFVAPNAGQTSLRNTINEGLAQNFIPPRNSQLFDASFQLQKVGLPEGTITYELYATTGTWPDVTPTGAALAVSEEMLIENIPGGAPSFYNLQFLDAEQSFNGVNQRYMMQNIPYCIVIHATYTVGGDVSNRVAVTVNNRTVNFMAHSGSSSSVGDWGIDPWVNNPDISLLFIVTATICDPLADKPLPFDVPQRRPRIWAQQPPSEVAPVLVPAAAAVPFFECTSVQIFRKPVAQQPASLTAPVPMDLRETYERSWDNTNVIPFRPRLIPQQPPARAGPEHIFVPAHFLLSPTDHRQKWPRIWAQQPPSETPSPFPFPSTFFDVWRAPDQNYRRAKIAQQPPSSSEPTFVETVPEEFFEDWQTPFDRFYPKRVAQQPPSESKPEATLPSTFFEAWRSAQERFYPKQVPQQPPSETKDAFTPGTVVVPTWFETPQQQVFPRRWAQQPPSEAKPVATLPSTFFEAWRSAQERFYPKRIAQQPPSEVAPVLAETVPEEFFEDWQTPFDRFYPKAVARQPDSYVAPPFAPPYNDASSVQRFPRIWAQQPASETKPVATIPSTFFEAWRSAQERFYPKQVAQQPPSESRGVVTPGDRVVPTFFDAPQMQRWPRIWAQQPPSESKPVATLPSTFFEAWRAPDQNVRRSKIAQQPPSETPSPFPRPSTFFEAWRSADQNFRRAKTPQQPNSYSYPWLVEVPPREFFEDWQTPFDRYYPKRLAQQPPSESAPVRTLPSTYFEAWRSADQNVRRSKVAQQPPSLSAPAAAPAPAFFDAPQTQAQLHQRRKPVQQPVNADPLPKVVALSPDPVQIIFTVPPPALSIELTPDPVQIPFIVPDPVVDYGQGVTPPPVVVGEPPAGSWRPPIWRRAPVLRRLLRRRYFIRAEAGVRCGTLTAEPSVHLFVVYEDLRVGAKAATEATASSMELSHRLAVASSIRGGSSQANASVVDLTVGHIRGAQATATIRSSVRVLYDREDEYVDEQKQWDDARDIEELALLGLFPNIRRRDSDDP